MKQNANSIRPPRRNDQGQALIMVTFGVPFLLGLMGLVVDVGWGYYRKQVAQAAADAAALAGAVHAGTGTITCNSSGIVCQASTVCTSATTAGTTFKTACQYGSINGVAEANIFIAADTTSPRNGAAVNYWVTATVSEPLPLTFLRVMGLNSGTIGATATAGVILSGSGSGGCVYALDPSKGGALTVAGGSSLTSSCGVFVNSNNPTNAAELDGSGSSIGVTGGQSVNIVGTPQCNGSACSSSISPWPPTRVSGTDPFAMLPAPSFSGCDHMNYQLNNGSDTQNPGVFCGGIQISDNSTLTLNPGVYILNGGGLSITSTNSTLTGTGVMFYNTSSGYPFGPLAISGQPTVTLSPPTSGTYEGILYFKDRAVCSSAADSVTGNTNTTMSGSIYSHCSNSGGGYVPSELVFAGQSTPGHYVGLIADQVKIAGNTHIILDPTGGTNNGIGLGSVSAFLIQ